MTPLATGMAARAIIPAMEIPLVLVMLPVTLMPRLASVIIHAMGMLGAAAMLHATENPAHAIWIIPTRDVLATLLYMVEMH